MKADFFAFATRPILQNTRSLRKPQALWLLYKTNLNNFCEHELNATTAFVAVTKKSQHVPNEKLHN